MLDRDDREIQYNNSCKFCIVEYRRPVFVRDDREIQPGDRQKTAALSTTYRKGSD